MRGWGRGRGREACEKRGRVSQSSDVAFFSFFLFVRFQTPLKLLSFSLEPALSLFSMHSMLFSPTFLPRLYVFLLFHFRVPCFLSCRVFPLSFFPSFSLCHLFFLRFTSFPLTPSSHLASRSGWGGYRVDLRPPQGDNYL